MERPTIRRARQNEAGVLIEILTTTFLADQTRYIAEPVDPEHVMRVSVDLVARRLNSMAVAELDGRPVGMVYIEGARIEAVNVLPGYQRRGVGRALVGWAERELAEAGERWAMLDTQEANRPARAFYESCGYAVVGRWEQTEFTKAAVPMVRMGRALE